MWETLHVIATCLVLPLFLAQFVCWILLRLHRIALSRWRRLATVWLSLGLSYLIVGGLLMIFGPPESGPIAFLGISGGIFNALVAAFHLKTVDIIMRPRIRRPPSPPGEKDQDSSGEES